MQWKPFLAATAAGGIAGNLLDMVIQGGLLTNMYYSKSPQLFRQDMNLAWLIAGDFIAMAVFVLFYNMCRGSFGAGMMNGLRFGACAGFFQSFPMFLFLHMMLVGYPYSLGWVTIFYTVLWYAVAGAITGIIYGKVK